MSHQGAHSMRASTQHWLSHWTTGKCAIEEDLICTITGTFMLFYQNRRVPVNMISPNITAHLGIILSVSTVY